MRKPRGKGTSGTALGVVAGLTLACGGGAAETPRETAVPGEVLAASSIRAAVAADAAAEVSAGPPVVTVYKSPTCGCCANWVAHMREAGFEVVTHDVTDLASVKAEHGVSSEHQSCHTATVGQYVVEGHVPADLVERLLEEQPDVAGLAVPGMPRGSPGMEVADGTKDPYDVIAFSEDGSGRVYASR